jgi:hypothetical protein
MKPTDQFRFLLLYVQTASTNEVKTESEETAVTNGNTDDNIDNVKDEDTAGDEDDEDNVNGNEDDENDEQPVPETVTSRRLSAAVSHDLLRDVASRLAGVEWKTLAQKLKFQDDDIAYFESDQGTTVERAVKMLTVWKVS